jgi:5-methylcytosine-specific restriction endonuclease McrA
MSDITNNFKGGISSHPKIPKQTQNNQQQDFTSIQKRGILKRDGYKCVMYGAGSENGVELHIDHIKPKDMGGLATIEDGQTLCSQHTFEDFNEDFNINGHIEWRK